jgi:single-stranded-DNA-specific exonuclease
VEGADEPVFFIKEVEMFEKYSMRVGSNGEHLRLFLSDKNNRKMPGIAFGEGDKYELLKGKKFGLCFRLDKNVYKEKTSLQLKIKHIVI